jgi:hypothetical protein
MRNEVYNALISGGGGIMLAEDRQKLDLIEKEMRADIAKLMTPEQLLEYEIRSDSTSSTMRSRLGSFKPTEDEFRAIYALQKAMDVEFSPTSVRTAEEAQARSARQKEVDAQIMATMSPDRAQQYKFATDPAYNQINRVLTRFGLPQQVAVDVVAVQQSTQQRATALRQDRTLTPQQRNEQLAALQQEAQAKVSATLGSRVYEAYQEYGGQWVNNIAPRPAPTPPAALPR